MNKAIMRILPLFKGHTKTWLAVGFLMLLQSMVTVGITVLISTGLNVLDGDLSARTTALLIGAIFLMGIAQWGLGYAYKYYAKKTVIRTLRDLQTQLFHKLIRKKYRYFTEHSSGTVISRITGDTEAFGQFINMFASQSGAIMSLIVLIITLFVMNSYLAIWVCALLPFIIFASLTFRRLSRSVSSRMYEMFAELNANIKESLTGMEVTKNFVQEQAMFSKFLHVNERAYDANLRQGKVFSSIMPLTSLLSSIAVCLILYVGGSEVLSQQLTLGALYLFVETVQRIWDPVASLANFSNQIQDGIAAAERMLVVLDDEDQDAAPTAEKEVKWESGDIRFDRVGFSYGNGEMQLKDFTLHIKEGESVALVGHTGAGKTTVGRILLRFYDIQEGRITIGQNNMHHIAKKAQRERIGYIPQVPFLFSGTVEDNLKYGNPGVSNAEITQAMRSIRNGAWLDDLPDGLASQVGEMGRNLSLGQRQLIAIVRIMLKDPALIIMDEATSNIDPFTERYIKEALLLLMKGRTSIMIAHRLSTIREADKIVVLRSGRKVEEGSHDQLIRHGTVYKELYHIFYRQEQGELGKSAYESIG